MSASNGNKDTLGITGANIFILWKATILINVKGVDITVVMYCYVMLIRKKLSREGRFVAGGIVRNFCILQEHTYSVWCNFIFSRELFFMACRFSYFYENKLSHLYERSEYSVFKIIHLLKFVYQFYLFENDVRFFWTRKQVLLLKTFLGLATCNCTAYFSFLSKICNFCSKSTRKTETYQRDRNISSNDHKKYDKAFQKPVKCFRHSPE